MKDTREGTHRLPGEVMRMFEPNHSLATMLALIIITMALIAGCHQDYRGNRPTPVVVLHPTVHVLRINIGDGDPQKICEVFKSHYKHHPSISVSKLCTNCEKYKKTVHQLNGLFLNL
ncbi:MAG: hypothetical protein ABII02_04120 [Candidatus Magasanikbacteria bacterium]